MSASFDTDVTLTLEAAFDGSGPFVDETSATWTDITEYLRDFSTSFGRTGWAPVNIGTLTLTLDNNDSRFSPRNTAGPYTPYIRPSVPIRLSATYDSDPYPLFYGSVVSWTVAFPTLKDQIVRVQAQDAMRGLNRATSTDLYNEELAHIRIGHLLDAAGFPASMRDLETSTVMVQKHQAEGATVHELIRQVADTDGGVFYINAAGEARFHDRTYRDAASPIAVLEDDSAELQYMYAEFETNDDSVTNQVVVTPTVNVELGYDAAGPFVADAPGSQSIYGVRSLPLTTLHVSASDAFSYASDRVTLGRKPGVEVQQINIDPGKAERQQTGSWATVLGFDLGQMITVRQTPQVGDGFDEDVFIESVAHSVNARSRTWDVTVGTSRGAAEGLMPSGSLEPSETLQPS